MGRQQHVYRGVDQAWDAPLPRSLSFAIGAFKQITKVLGLCCFGSGIARGLLGNTTKGALVANAGPGQVNLSTHRLNLLKSLDLLTFGSRIAILDCTVLGRKGINP